MSKVVYLYLNGYTMEQSTALSSFIKYHREQAGLTQEELAHKAGVGLRLVREIEQGKQTLQLDSVNKVLALFGHEMRPQRKAIDPYMIWRNYLNKAVIVQLKNRKEISGVIIDTLKDEEQRIVGWKLVPNANTIAWQQKRDKKLEQIILHNEIQEIQLQS